MEVNAAFVSHVADGRCRISRGRSRVCAVPPALRDAALDIAALPPQRRYAKLAEMGVKFETQELNNEERNRKNRVPGCTSVVHLLADVDKEGKVHVRGSSDAKITAGLLSLLVSGLKGATVDEVLSMSFEEFAGASALDSFLAPSRANSFSNVITTLQRQLSDRRDTSVQKARQLVVDRQGDDVAVLLSGGVDSSVALRLLLEQGCKPIPFYLKIWLEDELAHLGECPWEEDLRYASAVADQVGLQVEPVPLQKEYWEQVVEYTVREAKLGRTPNPDVMCNTRVKFGVFLDNLGKSFPRVASGHYASTRMRSEDGITELLCSGDEFKDQTYFLAHLKQHQIAKAHFPIGAYTKARVREMAERFDLPNKLRRDSQGICFLGRLKFDDFLEYHLGSQSGPFIEYETGTELGAHRGYWFYTLGQRKGLGLSGGPWYVVSKDSESNVVYLSRHYHDSDKPRNQFMVDSMVWIAGKVPSEEERQLLRVKVRHGARSHNCRLALDGDHGAVQLEGKDPVGLAPGQFAVFYLGDVCLGSGVICNDRGLDFAPKFVAGRTQKRLQAHYMP
eukprot:Plantae.Rhodophyta-Purpureofilum_apyrenoidigerum.ctg32484.p1 GENE.Plantae.Rhodophyta-Purpureofilum_apyrenoidigerum.ctg32484~~Plantae.Rhodophyta-Purpureofilum_apyrenoidigerum.ctg32484.p1  ORF type:complete len:562 (-),score=95.47 Plantae.Rhodophyta-Purpureofilum_apyrenoidigerum.ctg32484:67-1752(-)